MFALLIMNLLFFFFFITLTVSGSRQNKHGFNIATEIIAIIFLLLHISDLLFGNKAAGLRRKLAGQMMTLHT